jgi:branched-chain amino acid transport system permease protein
MEYSIHLLTFICIYAILALSLNLLVGYTGLVSAAHAGFFAIGAYTTALLITEAKWNFFFTFPVGIFCAIIFAFLIGYVLSRFRGDYYVLGSIGFCSITYTILLNWQSLTGGPLGISGISRPNFFGFILNDNFYFLLLSAVCCLLVYLICNYITNSAFGRTLKAIREDEQVLSVFGYQTSHFKLVIFCISAGLASIAGALYSAYINYIDPSTFHLNESVFIISIIILGGLANLRGSLLGAIFLMLLPEALRFVGFSNDIAAQMRQAVYGLLLILFMMYRPQGFMGEYRL